MCRAIALAIDRQSLHTLWGGDFAELSGGLADSVGPSRLLCRARSLTGTRRQSQRGEEVAGRKVGTAAAITGLRSPSDSGQAEIDQIQSTSRRSALRSSSTRSPTICHTLVGGVDGWDLGTGSWCPTGPPRPRWSCPDGAQCRRDQLGPAQLRQVLRSEIPDPPAGTGSPHRRTLEQSPSGPSTSPTRSRRPPGRTCRHFSRTPQRSSART